ncbi:MAG: hypothetical protein CVU56_24185 [Deltaproteobacteria bacterium HGW-Deltaproteobacteria-14]|jgi:murein L,D-transpeptidase YcbB/YkuD|nr:MAG: hypothetical protein CVU56_24185 [Deltaproteobacteria bacterium HGW-Deltaproteobacteria-14]
MMVNQQQHISPSRRRRTSLRVMGPLALAMLGGLTVAACSDDSPTPRSSGVGRVEGPGVTPPPTIDPLDPSAPSVAAPGVPSPSSRAAFVRKARAIFDGWAEREAGLVKDYTPSFKDALGKLSWFKKLTTRAYEGREYRPFFSDGAQLTESGDKLLEALYAVEDHGLEPEPYDLPALRATVKAFSDRALGYQEALTIPAESKAAWDFVTAQKKRLPLDDAALAAAAAAADYSDDDVAVLDRVQAHLDAIFTARAGLNVALRDLDIALASRCFRYIYDMRFSRRAHPFFADESDGAGVERTAVDVYATFEKTDFNDIGPSLGALVPKIPEYSTLMAGLARYRRFAAEHPEHIELPSKVERLKARDKPKADDLVKQLQERLAQEEYWDGPIDGKFGPDLEAAIKFYQETHQLKDAGRIDRITRISLNTTFAERARQIALALRRDRESDLHQGEFPLGTTTLRGRVNIPAFQATFFKDGVVARQHNVIVGNNNIEVDEQSGKRGHFNQTRMFSALMATVVLNPTWKVPRRIKEQELDEKLMDEPDFYEKHNYEVKTLSDGTEQVTQLPGPGNALGLVKFLFPNQFSIYMHDTPNKRLFKRPVRAFSHGCMRTEDPLDLARWLLVDQGDWTAERFDEVLASRQEYGVALKEKVPMSIDYSTVGVHPSGRLMFYADIYRYDRDYFDGKTPYRADRDFYQTVMLH